MTDEGQELEQPTLKRSIRDLYKIAENMGELERAAALLGLQALRVHINDARSVITLAASNIEQIADKEGLLK
jgi:hypothetical protein